MRLSKKGKIIHLLNITALSAIFIGINVFLGYKFILFYNEAAVVFGTLAFSLLFMFLEFIIYTGVEFLVTFIYNYINEENSGGLLFESVSDPYINYMENKYMHPLIRKCIERDEDYEEAYREVERFLKA